MFESLAKLNFDSLNEENFIKLLKSNKPQLVQYFAQGKADIVKLSNIVLEIITMTKVQTQNKDKWANISKIWETAGFILFASLDLKTYLEMLCILEDNIQQKAIIRTAYTQLYEISEDIEQLIGKTFFQSLDNINAGQFKDELCKKKKILSSLKKQYEGDLKNIRVNVGAHRELNYTTFHQIICNLDYVPAILLILKFGNALDSIAETLQKIMQTSAKYISSLPRND